MNHKIINQASILFNLIKKQNQKKKHLPLGSVQSYVSIYTCICIYRYTFIALYTYICAELLGHLERSRMYCAPFGISRYVVGHV